MPAPPLDPEILEDLATVEDGRRLFEALGKRVEFWEGLCLVKGDRQLMREEVRRLAGLHEAGHAAGVARSILEKLKVLRATIGPLVEGLQNFLALVPGAPQDPERVGMILGFVAISPRGREAASRWVADPARHVTEATGKIQTIADVVESYRQALRRVRPAPPALEKAVFEPPPAPALEKAVFEPASADASSPDLSRATEGRPASTPEPPPVMEKAEFVAAPARAEPPAPPTPAPPPSAEAPAPAAPVGVPAKVADPFVTEPKAPPQLPPGVDPDVLDDVRRVEQCRKVFEVTHQQIEVWEVFCLVLLDEATKPTLDRLLHLRSNGSTEEFTEGALTLFEKLLDMRSKYGRFVRQLRDYIAQLSVGHFGKDTMETALGFIVASARGRQRAEQWLAEPKRHMTEAAGRLEDIISKTMNYETALRMSQ